METEVFWFFVGGLFWLGVAYLATLVVGLVFEWTEFKEEDDDE